MDIPRFLDLAEELETQISKLYARVADSSGDPPIAARLKALAGEELNHANAIRRGKRYIEEMPDEFSGPTMSHADARAGLEEIMAFQSALKAVNLPLGDQLRKLLDLEKRFEKIHIGVLVKIKDPSLKRLFNMLSKGDQSHMLILLGLIDSLGEPSK